MKDIIQQIGDEIIGAHNATERARFAVKHQPKRKRNFIQKIKTLIKWKKK